MSYFMFMRPFLDARTGDLLPGFRRPLSALVEELNDRANKLREASERFPNEEKLLSLVDKVDSIPFATGLGPKSVTAQEFYEFWVLLQLLAEEEEATLRALADDQYPGTIIGKLLAVAEGTGVSRYTSSSSASSCNRTQNS